jgi:Integrase core domain
MDRRLPRKLPTRRLTAGSERGHRGRTGLRLGRSACRSWALQYEHLFRGVITDGDTLDMEVHRFRIIYNTIRPHQGLGDRTPCAAYTGCDQQKTAR